MKDNISKLKDCYGCGVCTIGCPVKIIDLIENKDGFYSPIVTDQDKCIECGICLDICAYNHDEIAVDQSKESIRAYGCWSKDKYIRESSTTGGLGTELAKNAIKENRQVCAVRYNIPEARAEHYVANSLDDLKESQGSKYIPSFTQPGLKAISLKKPGMVCGLPCQIDSFRRLIRRFKVEENFQLVDLLCHGVPPLLLWRTYLKEEETNFGNIESVKFRFKKFGWHKSACIKIVGDKGTFIQPSKENLFYKIFFSDICLNKCCLGKCKYKLTSSSADIRIGDYWGNKYIDSFEGINVLFALTQTGREMVERLKESCTFEESSILEAIEKQPAVNPPCTPMRKIGLDCLKKQWSLSTTYHIIKYGSFITAPKILIEKIKSKLSK